MALPASKRRKTEHTSSEEDESASFASFSDASVQDQTADGLSPDRDGEDLSEDGAALGNDTDGLVDGQLEDGVGEEEVEEEGESDSTVAYEVQDGEHEHSNGNARKEPNGRDETVHMSKVHKNGLTAKQRALRPDGASYTSGTFKSNIFKLQVDELLGQIRPKHGRREAPLDGALHLLKKTIEQIPAKSPLPIDEAERSLLSQKIAIPFPHPRPPKEAKYKLEYAKPTNINVVGSYPLNLAPKARDVLEVDMTVQMPASLFQEKDYLNYRYFYKRAYYIASIAAGLQIDAQAPFDVGFVDFGDDPLKPALAVTPKAGFATGADAKPAPKWRINIIPCIALDVFAAEKIAPHRNSVRPVDTTGDANNDGTSKLTPTPSYNSSLRAEMLVTPYLRLLHSTASSCPAFRDACLLGSTWLRQRGIRSCISGGGFGTFEWSALMALLLQGGGSGGKPLLSAEYSSYQLLKATLQLITVKDMSKHPLVLGQSNSAPTALEDGAPLAWDTDRKHNLLYKMTPWSYRLLQQEARNTLTALSDQLFDSFNSTFILRTDQNLLRYNYLVSVERANIGRGKPTDAHLSLSQERNLYEVLRRGLGDRANLVHIATDAAKQWQLGSARPTATSVGKLRISLMVNPNTVSRTVDHGPSAESKTEAAAFRKFWGNKAELRRFKDGSILESLIWNAREDGRSVLEQVVRYLLAKHFAEAAGQSAVFFGDGFHRMIRHSSNLTAFQPLMEAYKKMESDVRGLDGLPLAIRQIAPADAQLRFASINASPAGQSRQRPVPANVTIQFEGSARWPDDLVAIQRTKIAFLLKLSQLLEESTDSVTPRVGLENEEHDILNQAYLDITYETGVTFRMRIHHDREQVLLERQLKDKSLDPRSRQIAALALAAYKREFLMVPAHTQAIARLCNRYAALSGTIRLAKKWFASHLLHNHIADEVIELIVARTFVQPWPWQTPSSVQTGFLRTLFWLARWDWRDEPLIVDLSGSGELKQADAQAIKTRSEAWRKLDPAMNRVVLFAASNVDHDGTTWTDGRPSKVIAGRMTALARAAIAEVEKQGTELEPANLFVSPLSDYDFVLHLNAGFSGGKRLKAGKSGKAFRNVELDDMSDTTLIGYNPAADFSRELENLYGSAVLFFYGGKERAVIAGLWSPQTAPRSWKVNLAYSTTPVRSAKEGDVNAAINKGAILAEIARLGGDLVDRIDVNR